MVDLIEEMKANARGQPALPDHIPSAFITMSTFEWECDPNLWRYVNFTQLYTYLRGFKKLHVPSEWRSIVPPLPSEIWRVTVEIGGASNTENIFQILLIDQTQNLDDFWMYFSGSNRFLLIFFDNLGGKLRVWYTNPWFTRDQPMIYPWYTVIYPGKTCVYDKPRFWPNPWFTRDQPMIYPW